MSIFGCLTFWSAFALLFLCFCYSCVFVPLLFFCRWLRKKGDQKAMKRKVQEDVKKFELNKRMPLTQLYGRGLFKLNYKKKKKNGLVKLYHLFTRITPDENGIL